MRTMKANGRFGRSVLALIQTSPIPAKPNFQGDYFEALDSLCARVWRPRAFTGGRVFDAAKAGNEVSEQGRIPSG